MPDRETNCDIFLAKAIATKNINTTLRIKKLKRKVTNWFIKVVSDSTKLKSHEKNMTFLNDPLNRGHALRNEKSLVLKKKKYCLSQKLQFNYNHG